MAELPKSIGNLKNLKEFLCDHNKLTGEYFVPSFAPPKPVHGISKTEHPDMAELPESIGNLKNLNTCYCHANQLPGEYFVPSLPDRNQYAVSHD